MTLRQLLYPLSLPYQLVTSLRNWAFDKSILPSREFEVPVIAIGNLSTGGTGKTPMVEFLIKHFANHQIGLVTRGYGRKTKGLVLATPQHRFDEIGDEPFQVFHKFPQIKLVLAERRVEGIEALLKKGKLDLILLDDAYQHRYVKPGFQILLTTFGQPFFKDLVLPAGNLRESRSGKKRADVIILTKCPDELSTAQAADFKRRLKPAKSQAVFFAGLEYGQPLNHLEVKLHRRPDSHSEGRDQILALTGIANPAPFLHYLGQHYQIKKHLRFPDHHAFSAKEIAEIEKLTTESGLPLLTTEKDWVRLKGKLMPEVLEHMFYLPMRVKILFGEESRLLKEVEGFVKG